jgi:hypothetical protein
MFGLLALVGCTSTGTEAEPSGLTMPTTSALAAPSAEQLAYMAERMPAASGAPASFDPADIEAIARGVCGADDDEAAAAAAAQLADVEQLYGQLLATVVRDSGYC